MRLLRAFAMCLPLLLCGQIAYADDPPPTTTSRGFHPNRTLENAGIAIFLSGYAPVAVAALPSIVGGVFRGVFAVGTLGIGVILTCGVDADSSSTNYLCSGTHGAVQLALPIAGPFLFAANHPRDSLLNPDGDRFSPATRGLLYVSGTVQAVGAAFLVASLAAGGDDDANHDHDHDPPRSTSPAPGPNRPLLMTGGGLLGFSYATTVLPAFVSLLGGMVSGIAALVSLGNGKACADADPCHSAWGGAELAIPIVGPFLFAHTHPRDEILNPNGSPLTSEARVLLDVSGGAQAAGVALSVVALALGNNGRDTNQVHFAPLINPSTIGVSAMASW